MAFYLGSYLTDILDNIIISRNLNTENLYLCGQLSYFSDDINTIGDYAFYYCGTLISVNLSQVTTIGNYAFCDCRALTSIDLSKVTTIGSNAFYYCDSLISVNLPQVTTIGSNAFSSCSALSSIDLSQVISIGSRTFYNCGLINVNCPKLLSIPGGCSLRMTGSIGNPSRYGAFAYCRSLQTISVPLVSFIGSTAFAFCSYLTSFIGPQVLTVDGSYLISSARSGSRTYTATLRGGAFAGCYRLSIVSLPKVSKINTYAFTSCYNLLSLYLLGSSIPTLSSTAFDSTPISTYTTSTGGIYGSIYVPASLYDSYLTATGWSIYSARIVSV